MMTLSVCPRCSLRSLTRTLAAAALLALLMPSGAEGQILNRIRNRVQREVSQAIEDAAARAARRAVNATEEAIVCRLTDERCLDEARSGGRELVIVDGDDNVVGHENVPASAQAAPASAAPLRPGEGAWANYDFVPGERVLFFDDYSQDFVGDFPRRLEFREGAMEIVEWQNARFLRVGSSEAAFDIVLPEELPERFTLEFDFFMGEYANYLYVYPVGPDGTPAGDNRLASAVNWSLGIRSRSEDGVAAERELRSLRDEIVPVRLMVDGSYVKAFGGEQRVANIPNADLGRSNRIRFDFQYIDEGKPPLIGNIRIAAGGREMLYDRLVRDGRVVTGGILFETGSATLLPESTPTLKDMVQALGRDTGMRIRVEGHTDDTGNDEANLRLSEERARSVVDYLVREGGIDPSRLEAVGMGETQPAADNATSEGRQTNRRVELVVIG